VTRFEIVILIPESTRKRRGGSPSVTPADGVVEALPTAVRAKLNGLREEILVKSPDGSVDSRGLMAANERFDGNMYREIPREAWEKRSPAVEVLIASGLRGLVASRDPIPRYDHSMAESTAPFGKLNRWWRDHGLPLILASYLNAVRPRTVVDLLSLEYRDSVDGYAGGLTGIDVQTINFPGMGRASQPLRGERVTSILRTGKT
jgi:hypothetical protein